MPERDAVIVGSGPNGLAAAIELARAGLSVLVVEGADTIGGGARSAALTLPGFTHDVCSAVYPMAAASPYLRTLPLDRFGLEWLHPPLPFAHPLDGGTAAVFRRSVEDTAAGLGEDADAYRRLIAPLVRAADGLFADLLGPPFTIPRHPLAALRFGLPGLRSGRGFAEAYFRTREARALWAGVAAHAILPLESRPGGAVALMLGLAGHAHGWPVARGGAQALTDALAGYFRSLGGEIETGRWVKSLADLPPAKAVLFDTSPRQLLAIAGDALPAGYARRLRKYRHGPGVFKVDWALSAPVPWAAVDVRGAGTVHVGGTLDEVAAAERAGFEGRHAEKPFVLFVQPGVIDPSRAPAGKHVGWGYCHVPPGGGEDMLGRIEAQMERFAPGFRDVVLGRHVTTAAAMEAYNPNYVGGDISGGVTDLWQLFTRPVAKFDPYRTANSRLWLCSSSTPPGGGVHGMCGWAAARSVLRRLGVKPAA
ncbi:phytoene desaturase family protein [Urbifossiella limnaea]|uniref:Ribulose-1,5-biphosphate synthetase n=1 Tax=Urbifossiella limnaea TaxID=2528023 RepID=A0A517Y0E5_9BACT|nr:NAD(P)/FAD-dependent oxidoreductase [Urbifossiella limnaea]QDU23178.1 ribulose-1,5-biphosphate synthetase [Urbifossiella limnaea]